MAKWEEMGRRSGEGESEGGRGEAADFSKQLTDVMNTMINTLSPVRKYKQALHKNA